MRSLPFVLIACVTATACTADRATAPSPHGSLAAAPSFASGEGDEASANARLDLREVRAALSATPSNASSKWSWTAIRVDVSSDGNEGYTVGYTELTLSSGTVLPGRYLAYWAKQDDGTWRMEAYKRIPRAAGAVSLTPPPGFETPDNKHRRYFPNTDAESEAAVAAATDREFSDLAQIVGNAESFARYAAPSAAQSGNAASVGWEFGRAAIAAAHALTR